MKTAIVISPWYRRESPPPDVAMAAAILKKAGHEVTVFDFNNFLFHGDFKNRGYWKFLVTNFSQKDSDEFFSLTRPLFQEYAERILASGADVILFKVVGHTFENALKLASEIKAKNPAARIVFCGVLLGDRRDLHGFIAGQGAAPYDWVVCGEDEAALPLLLQALERGEDVGLPHNGKVIDCLDGPHVDDLDELPFFDFGSFDLSSYRYGDRLELFQSKGCPRRCAFCADWRTEKKYRSMSGRRIFAELKHQHSRHGVRHVTFCDKLIDGDLAALRGLTEMMADAVERGEIRDLSWSGDAMIREELTADLLRRMHRAGCGGLGFGVESGSDRVLKAMRKGFSRKLAERLVSETRSAGIHTSVNILVGFPSETEADFQETLDFITTNKSSINEIRVTHAGCVAFPFTDLGQFPERFDISAGEPERWRTADGSNDHGERLRRCDRLAEHVLSLDIPLRINSRLTKTGRTSPQGESETK